MKDTVSNCEIRLEWVRWTLNARVRVRAWESVYKRNSDGEWENENMRECDGVEDWLHEWERD